MKRPCTCDRCDQRPGAVYTLDQCRLCFLYHHDDDANRAWGGKGFADITEIEPGLWLGAAVEQVPPGIDAIVNLVESKEQAFRLPRGSWVRLLLAPIPDGLFPGTAWLDSTVDTVLRWRHEGLAVLIHCAAGVSRCALVTVAVLMKGHGWSAAAALERVADARPWINPNPHFRQGLKTYEDLLLRDTP
jgi:hypothetical protein